MRLPILAILGPTATGKSALGINLALKHGGEIISCDSTAVYRGFDIGTDKVPIAQRRGRLLRSLWLPNALSAPEMVDCSEGP